VAGFSAILASLGFALRPGWTVERFDRALQAIYDGFALQGRLVLELIRCYATRVLVTETVAGVK
jgi:hypothetical protein